MTRYGSYMLSRLAVRMHKALGTDKYFRKSFQHHREKVKDYEAYNR